MEIIQKVQRILRDEVNSDTIQSWIDECPEMKDVLLQAVIACQNYEAARLNHEASREFSNAANKMHISATELQTAANKIMMSTNR